jgi:hypothetical protein
MQWHAWGVQASASVCPLSGFSDIWPALIPKREAPCKTEKLVLSLKPTVHWHTTPESPQAARSRIYLLRFPIAEFAGPVARAATTQATTWSLEETTFVC